MLCYMSTNIFYYIKQVGIVLLVPYAEEQSDEAYIAYTVNEKAVSELWLPPLVLRVFRTKPEAMYG